MALIGLDSVLKKFGKLPERVTTLTKAAVSRNTDQIYAESMSQVPKNTGGLAASGQKIVTDFTGTVSYGGGSVDLGTIAGTLNPIKDRIRGAIYMGADAGDLPTDAEIVQLTTISDAAEYMISQGGNFIISESGEYMILEQ